MRAEFIKPEYVEYIPRELQNGILYISRQFSTASHLCCCGCGTKTVTPIRETEYSLREKGGSVSLSPSIGNWNHPCQSHYIIKDNRVIWAAKMSRAEIRRGRNYDDALKAAHFGSRQSTWWSRLLKWFENLSRR